MIQNPYERFSQDELILRDELALDRTLLANERTLLAYLRAAVALLLAGVSIIHFSDTAWFLAVGVACVPGSLAAALLGLLRFKKMKARLARMRNSLDELHGKDRSPKT